MPKDRLHSQAWTALLLTGFYYAAEALSATFVGVYLWVNSSDFDVIFRYYMAVYAVTPVCFIFAGWYAKVHDRLHVYRLGLAMHALYYGVILALRERAADYSLVLGMVLGVTWGVFWAGANTITFDVTSRGRREYYFGMLAAVTGTFQLVAPLAGGVLIAYAPDQLSGYHRIFALVVVLYSISFAMTFRLAPDKERRPYRIKRALLPGKDQRDWRLVLLASASLAGSFNIFQFLLSLLMYIETTDEVKVGGFASYQAIIGILTSYFLGRLIVPKVWKRYLFWGTVILVAGGVVIAFNLSPWALVFFGLTRTVSGTMVNIPHSSLRFDVISKSVEEPSQRIEYICAWEVPLAIGRLIMMSVLLVLSRYGGMQGIQITLLLLCLIRILTYLILTRTTALKEAEMGSSSAPAKSAS